MFLEITVGTIVITTLFLVMMKFMMGEEFEA